MGSVTRAMNSKTSHRTTPPKGPAGRIETVILSGFSLFEVGQEKPNAANRPDVPSECHGDAGARLGTLRSEEQFSGRVGEQDRMRAKLVLEQLAESSGATDQSTERRPVHIMIVKVQPSALVSANQLSSYDETFDQVHQRKLLQIPLRVIAVVRYHVSNFLWCDSKGLQYLLANI